MKNGLYHRDLPGGIPLAAVVAFLGPDVLHLNYSRHARMAALADRYTRRGAWQAPHEVEVCYPAIVEAQIEDGVAVKIVVRLEMDAFRDLVLVLSQPDDARRSFVRTLWLNDAGDNHNTLDASKYAN